MRMSRNRDRVEVRPVLLHLIAAGLLLTGMTAGASSESGGHLRAAHLFCVLLAALVVFLVSALADRKTSFYIIPLRARELLTGAALIAGIFLLCYTMGLLLPL